MIINSSKFIYCSITVFDFQSIPLRMYYQRFKYSFYLIIINRMFLNFMDFMSSLNPKTNIFEEYILTGSYMPN